jgi:hypothetical protein
MISHMRCYVALGATGGLHGGKFLHPFRAILAHGFSTRGFLILVKELRL